MEFWASLFPIAVSKPSTEGKNNKTLRTFTKREPTVQESDVMPRELPRTSACVCSAAVEIAGDLAVYARDVTENGIHFLLEAWVKTKNGKMRKKSSAGH